MHDYCVALVHRSFLVHEPRVSTCELEVDVQAMDIINRKEIDMGKWHGSQVTHDPSTRHSIRCKQLASGTN